MSARVVVIITVVVWGYRLCHTGWRTKMKAQRKMPRLPSAVTIAAVSLLLFVFMIPLVCLVCRRRNKESFGSGWAVWTPLDAGEDPRPLLELAVQRIAADRGELSGPSVEVVRAWRSEDAVGNDRWYRWEAVACFFKADDAYGTCETLDLRMRTAWTSSRPPTEWPLVVDRSVPVGGPPVPTSEILAAMSHEP